METLNNLETMASIRSKLNANFTFLDSPNLGLRGFNRLEPNTIGIPSYDSATRTFSLAVKGGETYFQFWAGGVKFQKTTTQEVIWDDVSGTYYFYFDTSGVLQVALNTSITEAIFLQSAICGLCYWDAVAGVVWNAIDEQHGVVNGGGMDSSSHFNLHMTRGFKWVVGGEISGLADASDVYTSISIGFHMDEDITNVNALITTTPFMYRSGANGEWKITSDDLKIGHIVSGDTYCSWNEWTGATWQLTECSTSTDYVIMMMIKNNFETHPYRKIIGQVTYASRSAAREGLANELSAIHLEGLSSTESEFQFAWIAKRNGDLEDDGNGNAYIDLRGVPIHAFS